MHFIFGIIDVTIDAKQLAKKSFEFCPLLPEKSRKRDCIRVCVIPKLQLKNVDLVSERKSGLVKFSVFEKSFSFCTKIQTSKFLTLNMYDASAYSLLLYLCMMIIIGN